MDLFARILSSRMMIANIITLIVMILSMPELISLLPPAWVVRLAAVVAALNLWLRWTTTGPGGGEEEPLAQLIRNAYPSGLRGGNRVLQCHARLDVVAHRLIDLGVVEQVRIGRRFD